MFWYLFNKVEMQRFFAGFCKISLTTLERMCYLCIYTGRFIYCNDKHFYMWNYLDKDGNK